MKNIRHHAAAALLLLLACALILAFAACNGEPSEPTGSSTATTTKATPSQSSSTTASGSSNTPTRLTYIITVVDTEGNPVVGVELKLCDGDNCLLPKTTNENGVAKFITSDALNWVAAFTEAPAGYVCEEEYSFPAGSTELTITLAAA